MNSFRLVVDKFHWSDQRFAIQVAKVEEGFSGRSSAACVAKCLLGRRCPSKVDSDSEDSEVEVCSETPEEAPLEAPQEAPLESHREAPPIAPSETPQQAPLEAPPAPPLAHPEGPSAPPARPLAPHSPPGSPSEERVPSFTSETSETDSRHGSLRSRDADLTFVDSDSEQDETPPEGLEETLPAPPVTTPETPQEAPLEAPQESPLDGRQVALPALLVTTPETPQEAPLEAPQEAPLEGRPEVPPARPVATPSAPGSPIEERVPSLTIGTNETDDCDDAQNDSGPGRLRSRNVDLSPTLADLAKNSVENEFNLSDLEQLKVRDFTGDVIVKDEFPLRQLHVGDKILLRNARGLAMNARELIEHIRTSIVLTLERGAVCTAREEGNELAINIKGSQTVRLDTVDLIRRACTSHCSLPNAEMPEISNLTITEINNIPVAIGSQPDQIAGSMREALETSGGNLTLHLVPQSLLDALAE
ncbi:uncharacterized protein LOC115924189 [Strongylocentrotus purpuratus]|uniref:Uncharacterized protein n=1 Tax=Strongylocentrotus purpuratus TaxID=7668 RepID=A0A7M7NUY7_STRPU|nr:uncharacterized protein LOC115924189 [Strongylocentrotus purpuratus]